MTYLHGGVGNELGAVHLFTVEGVVLELLAGPE